MTQDPRIARLTERQRACLRLVYRHQSSKQIARELGIKPSTVDEHMRNALQTLGLSKRSDAAILLATSEENAPQPLRNQSTRVPAADAIATLDLPDPQGRQHGGGGTSTLREEQASFDARSVRSGHLRLPFRSAGERHNDLNRTGRLGWIIVMPLLYAAAIGILAMGLHLLSTLVLKTTGISDQF